MLRDVLLPCVAVFVLIVLYVIIIVGLIYAFEPLPPVKDVFLPEKSKPPIQLAITTPPIYYPRVRAPADDEKSSNCSTPTEQTELSPSTLPVDGYRNKKYWSPSIIISPSTFMLTCCTNINNTPAAGIERCSSQKKACCPPLDSVHLPKENVPVAPVLPLPKPPPTPPTRSWLKYLSRNISQIKSAAAASPLKFTAVGLVVGWTIDQSCIEVCGRSVEAVYRGALHDGFALFRGGIIMVLNQL